MFFVWWLAMEDYKWLPCIILRTRDWTSSPS